MTREPSRVGDKGDEKTSAREPWRVRDKWEKKNWGSEPSEVKRDRKTSARSRAIRGQVGAIPEVFGQRAVVEDEMDGDGRERRAYGFNPLYQGRNTEGFRRNEGITRRTEEENDEVVGNPTASDSRDSDRRGPKPLSLFAPPWDDMRSDEGWKRLFQADVGRSIQSKEQK